MAELRRNVIDKALADINLFSNLQVEVSTRKRGKVIEAFQFTYQVKSSTVGHKSKKQVEKTYYGFTKTEIDKAAKPGESYFQVGQRLQAAALETKAE